MKRKGFKKGNKITETSSVENNKEGEKVGEATVEGTNKEDEKVVETFVEETYGDDGRVREASVEHTEKEEEKVGEVAVAGTKKEDEKVAGTVIEEAKKEDGRVGEATKEQTINEEENVGEASVEEESNKEVEKVVETSAAAAVEAESSEKKTPKGLKAKTKILKPRLRRLVKGQNIEGTSPVQATDEEKNESVLQLNKEDTNTKENNDMELNMMAENNKEDDKAVVASVEGNVKEIEKVAEVSAGASKNAELKTAKRLKAKGKIVKPRATQLVKTNIAVGTLQMKEENKEGKSTEKTNDAEESKEQKQESGNVVEKNNQNHPTQEKAGLAKNGKQKARKRGRRGGLKKNQKFNKELAATKFRQQKEPGGSEKIQKSEEKQDNLDNGEKNEKKKEKLGGLIFMCNAKTKPDCFRYRVMGVSQNKKNQVMGIKPGLKLFLYDYDIKLLYGIYQASSSGGMKLEHKAFGGSFPAQVRFKVVTDCIPLPEREFRKAIEENYDTKNKFKTELTPAQVSKLRKLFRPAPVHSTPLSSHYRPAPASSDADRERSKKNHYFHSHERDHRVSLPPRREEPRDLYLSEREYRTYGLKREERNQHYEIPTSDPYARDLDRDHRLLRHSDVSYERRDAVHTDPLYLSEREYRVYDLSARREIPAAIPRNPPTSAVGLNSYARDPYRPYSYGASSVAQRPETYLAPATRIEEGLNSRYGSDSLSDCYQTRRYHGEPTAELAPSSTASWYSYAGPSYSYR